MRREIRFTGDFNVVTRESLRPGGWYIGFACPHCRQHFAMMDEPTNTGKLSLSGKAAFQAVCPNCGQANVYAVADLVLFEAAQGGPTSTA